MALAALVALAPFHVRSAAALELEGTAVQGGLIFGQTTPSHIVLSRHCPPQQVRTMSPAGVAARRPAIG